MDKQTHITDRGCQNPALYVGTYGKYNSGSIQGDWVDITTFDNGRDFLLFCEKELHGNEHDPELMFQDYENFPEYFYHETMGASDIDDILQWWKAENNTREQESKNSLKVVDYNEGVSVAITGDTYPIHKTLKKMGGIYRNHKELGPCWVFSAKRREELEEFVKSGKSSTSTEKADPVEKPDKALLEEYLNEMRKVWLKDESMIEYYRKKTSRVIRLTNGGLMAFEKPSIETRFCFGYGCQTRTFEEAEKAADAAKSEKYFMRRNLDEIDRRIKAMAGERVEYDYQYDYMKMYLFRTLYKDVTINVWEYRWMNPCDVRDKPWMTKGLGDLALLGDEDRKIILEAEKAERNAFEKRLKTWWKRYGEKYIDTWTYWADE